MRKAKRIAKALEKMGLNVKELSDSGSSGDGQDFEDIGVKFMKLSPQNDLNDN